MLDYSKNVYLGVSEGADYESSIRFVNFKMADPIPQMKFWKNTNSLGNYLLGSLITKSAVRLRKFKIADPI